MKALGRNSTVVCALVIFALGVSAVIERTKIRKEHKHDILRRYPKHHTVKKILPESKRHATDYAFGTSYAKTQSKWNTVRHRRNRSGKHKFGGISWNGGGSDEKASWWNGANVCSRNETHEEVDKGLESQFEDVNSKTKDGNGTFSRTKFKSSLMSSECEATAIAYKCTNVRGKNGKLVTSVKIYECCPGFDRKNDETGCTKAYDVTDLVSTFERLNLTQMASELTKSGLDLNRHNYTIFALTNDAFNKLTIQDTDVSIKGHVVKGVYHTIDFDDEQLLNTTENPPTAIRINKYNTGADIIVTANCVPVVVKDMVATNGIIHSVQNLLPTAKKSLDQIVLDNPQLTQLSKVIGDLELAKDGHYTLFAPTDSAFENLKTNLRDKIFKGQQCGLAFLRQHLLPSVVCTAVVETQALTRNVQHHLINLIRKKTGNLTANGAPLIETDIIGINGVMHTIDGLLIPKNAGDIVDVMDRTETKEFLRMITDAGLTQRLQTLDNFTIFVPTNDALEEALSAGSSNFLTKDPKDFEKLLNYHIVPQRLSYHDLRDNMRLPTLDGKNHIRVNSYQSFPFNSIKTVQCAPVEKSYVDSCEDIVHVVSKVLQPTNGDVLSVLKNDGNFSSLVALVDSFKLNKLFTTKKLLTFFAPTNKAFESLSPASTKNLRQDAKVFTRVVKSHMLAGVLCCSGIFENTFTFSGPELNLDNWDVSFESDDGVTFNGVPVTSCDHTATNGVVHAIDTFVPEVLTKYGIDRRAKSWRRLGLRLGSDNFRHH